jgi:hypothetical protein
LRSFTGVKARIVPLLIAEFLAQKISTGNWDTFVAYWPGYDSPQVPLRLHHTETQHVHRYAGLKDPTIDKMIEKSEQTIDRNERIKLVKEIQIALLDKYTPMIWLQNNTTTTRATSTRDREINPARTRCTARRCGWIVGRRPSFRPLARRRAREPEPTASPGSSVGQAWRRMRFRTGSSPAPVGEGRGEGRWYRDRFTGGGDRRDAVWTDGMRKRPAPGARGGVGLAAGSAAPSCLPAAAMTSKKKRRQPAPGTAAAGAGGQQPKRGGRFLQVGITTTNLNPSDQLERGNDPVGCDLYDRLVSTRLGKDTARRPCWRRQSVEQPDRRTVIFASSRE